MRNNASQSRHSYGRDFSVADEEVGLVSYEVASGSRSGGGDDQISPPWVDSIEEVRYEMTKIKAKMKELAALHDKHLNRPTLDDSTEEEHIIDSLTLEITRMFQTCRARVQQVAGVKCPSRPELKLAQNASSSAARELQTLSTTFRQSQSAYLSQMKKREERASSYFQEPSYHVGVVEEDDRDTAFLSRQSQLLLDDNTEQVTQRQREIENVVRSISDLNVVFRDLASMIADQGTLLDRIDYNVEQTSIKVEAGHQQLVKAEKYHKNNRKMLAILVLGGLIVVLLIILLAVKIGRKR